jgi:hypothetical protein
MVPPEVTPFVPLTLRGRCREPPYSKGDRETLIFEKELELGRKSYYAFGKAKLV